LFSDSPSSGRTPPSHLAAGLSSVPFLNPANAARVFSRVCRGLSPSLAASLPGLLEEAPDPDAALIFFDRLLQESPEILRLLARHNFLMHYAVVVFGHSHFLGETLIQSPDLLQAFVREKNLDQSLSREEFHESLARFRSRSLETNVSLLLARFKRREYIRIMLRDVLKLAPLAETTAEISALSDVMIEDAMREADNRLQRRYGAPQRVDPEGRLRDTPFAILSLGKLGGNELNYCSDVDLMYIFGDGTEPSDAAISNREYFIRLAQEVTEILSSVSGEGTPFRIDLRLRPQGNEGELALSLSRALHYYAFTADDWERQALIKVRCSAGDAKLAREFIRGVQPHVYTESANFAAIKTALEARERMHKHRHRQIAAEPAAQGVDVKVDRGGIRDVEFLVQCLQRVYGGSEPWLRSRGTLFALQKLHDKRHISGKEFHRLTTAYEFLRHLEHRLQLRHGQQTHRLPVSGDDLRILQRSMEGYAPGEDRGADLTDLVQDRMHAVAEIYQRVVHQQRIRRQFEVPEAAFELRGIMELGASEQSHQQILERLGSDSPALYEIISQRGLSLPARRNLFRFLSAAFTSSDCYAALIRHPEAVAHALTLFETSEYLTDILIRYPEEILTLTELSQVPATGQRTSSSLTPVLLEGFPGQERSTGDPVFSYLAQAAAPYSEKLSLLRRQYRHRILASAARDITELRGVYESLAATTAIADDAISAALRVAGLPDDVAVIALGRLGSREFDVLSDADLLFIREENGDPEVLTKSAEQMMQALAAYTRDGMVFPVDARLRPRGGEGELLVTPAQLSAYFENEAQAWEAVMYTKARFVGGARALADRALKAVGRLFERFAADPAFPRAVREMRTKLEAAEPGEKSFKASPGAMYDIDFLTGYLMVQHAVQEKGGTQRDRVSRCAAAELLPKTDAAALDHAAELLRTVEHVVRLAVGRAGKWLPATEHARRVTETLTSQILGREFPQGLEAELIAVFARVRGICARMWA
jgi:glutamate-ammonia-ligase adenylyltransferase